MDSFTGQSPGAQSVRPTHLTGAKFYTYVACSLPGTKKSSYYLCCFFQVNRYLVITILLQFALPTLFWMPTPPLPQPVLPPMLRQLLYIGLRQGEKMRKHAWPHAWEWRPSGGSQRWITAVVGKWRRRAWGLPFFCVDQDPIRNVAVHRSNVFQLQSRKAHGRHRRSWRSSE